MSETRRTMARDIARDHLRMGDPLGWFEELYSRVDGDASGVPWADLTPNPNLVEWFERNPVDGAGKKALNVGSGLGDDAEELARQGFATTAFDISESAIAWSRKRYPESNVAYQAADLFDPPGDFRGAFDFVLEAYTLQTLPPDLRREATRAIASFVSPRGTLLVIARGRDSTDSAGRTPWPLTRGELAAFKTFNLDETGFEDYFDNEEPQIRRFRAEYRRLF